MIASDSAVVVYLLGLLGLALYRTWLTSLPLTAGDWTYVSPGTLHEWFPWPTVWDANVGFGAKQFYNSFEFPIWAIAGMLASLGVTWSLIEKILYFWPFAFLLPVGAWFFGVQVLGSWRWALMSAGLYATSTYFLTSIVRGELYLGMAQALAPIALAIFMKAVRNPSPLWAICAGAILGLQATYEIRVAYLTVGMCLLYLGILLITEPIGRMVVLRLAAAGCALTILAGLQAYWLLPLLTYNGDYGLPVANSPWLAFMRITHGMTGVSPAWTGGAPATFSTVPVYAPYFLFPIIAFLPLVRRRVRPEYLWLSLSALGAAFLIKQTNPPAGEIYDWLFHHLPGWNLFREASKLFFIVAISYAVLIPASLKSVWESARLGGRYAPLMQPFVSAALAGLCVLTLVAVLPLQVGTLGFTTRPLPIPTSFESVSQLVDRDPQFSNVLWLGGAYVNRANEASRGDTFYLTSNRHPLVELGGTIASSDRLVRFCVNQEVSFCYLDPSLFRFLLNRVAAGYVVAPAGPAVGNLPSGIDYQGLLNKVSAVLGSPQLMGGGDSALALWHISGTQFPIIEASAVAIVHGSTATTTLALPAIEALNLPVMYQEREDSAAQLAPAVRVEPGVNSYYAVDAPNQFVLFAKTAEAKLTISGGNQPQALARVATGNDGWGVFGPLSLESGSHRIVSVGSTSLGPLVVWTHLAEKAISGQVPSVMMDPTSAGAESFSVPILSDRRWVEVRSSYDPGWQGDGVTYHTVGDGLFNLFLLSDSTRYAQFSFATRPWETFGMAVSLAVAAVLAVSVVWIYRRPTRRVEEDDERPFTVEASVLNRTATYFAAGGVIVTLFAGICEALATAGLPSSIGNIIAWLTQAYGGDLYLTAEAFLTSALIFLALSVGLHILSLANSYKRNQQLILPFEEWAERRHG